MSGPQDILKMGVAVHSMHCLFGGICHSLGELPHQ